MSISTLHFETQVSENGAIAIPLVPERHGEKVSVAVHFTTPPPTPEMVQEFMDKFRGCLKGMTREEFYRQKAERIMGDLIPT